MDLASAAYAMSEPDRVEAPMRSDVDDDAVLLDQGRDALTRSLSSQEPLLEPERTRVEVGNQPLHAMRSVI